MYDKLGTITLSFVRNQVLADFFFPAVSVMCQQEIFGGDKQKKNVIATLHRFQSTVTYHSQFLPLNLVCSKFYSYILISNCHLLTCQSGIVFGKFRLRESIYNKVTNFNQSRILTPSLTSIDKEKIKHKDQNCPIKKENSLHNCFLFKVSYLIFTIVFAFF